MSTEMTDSSRASTSILFFIDSLAPPGGQERVVAKHIEYAHTIFQTSLLTKDNSESFYKIPSGISRYSLHTQHSLCMTSRLSRVRDILYRLISDRKKLKSRIDSIQPDYIYVSSPRNFIEIALATGKLSKIVVSEHSAHDAHNIIYKAIILLLYRFAHRFFVPTKIDCNHYRCFAIPSIYLPNPLPFEHKEKAPLETKVVLSIGRFTKDKRHLVLLEIWAQCKCRNDGWKLKIIGDGELRSEIIERIKEPDIIDSVEIMDPTKDVMSEYKKASIFALTSRREGFGLVLAEAMSFGLPCLSFSVPSGPLDIIENGVNGFLIEDGNTQKYAEKIDELAHQDGLRKKMSNQCIESITPFANEKVRDQFIDAMQQ